MPSWQAQKCKYGSWCPLSNSEYATSLPFKIATSDNNELYVRSSVNRVELPRFAVLLIQLSHLVHRKESLKGDVKSSCLTYHSLKQQGYVDAKRK
ncbi:hypothetical protein CDAR_200221 [Caerostris darwini]|uniref:Uncharacterized protein n=1 Tax=Caerostris darwini TaxID=1538125 RepID=A0AAV4RM91_9ARAC|nr:hypothetical protein CDAR_200221 [Caerostris darwini]